MSEKFNVFPSTKSQALAMLYLQHQDLKGKTPTEIYSMYLDAHDEIYKEDCKRFGMASKTPE